MSAKHGLGAGLDALFGESGFSVSEERIELPLEKLEPRKNQPRKQFDEEKLRELAESLKTHGIIQPIVVRDLEDGYYQILAGERRWRAARLANFSEVPVRIIKADERTAQEIALIENLQREDLNPLEESRGYRELMKDYHLTQEEVSQTVGKSRSAVANALRLLSLPEEVAAFLEIGALSAGHARALLPLEDAEAQLALAAKIAEKDLSVRQTETMVAALLKQKETPPAEEAPADEVDYGAVAAEELGRALGRRVKIVEGRKRGRIELEYYNPEDREALIDALKTMCKEK